MDTGPIKLAYKILAIIIVALGIKIFLIGDYYSSSNITDDALTLILNHEHVDITRIQCISLFLDLKLITTVLL